MCRNSKATLIRAYKDHTGQLIAFWGYYTH
ncbi:hypothetical protein Alsa1_CDS0156 [Staphylococcus phage Alsa_1]|nr:hypothetical protein Alsa1_CDS0156 [Staphylococcus phage Alsa_1]